METDIEDLERKFKSTLTSHKKYKKRLSNYIYALIEKGRIVEATYFYDFLYNIAMHNMETNFLGYRLAISRLDILAIRKFDKFLMDGGYDYYKILLLRLDVYYVVGDSKKALSEIDILFKNYKLQSNDLNVILDYILRMRIKEAVPILLPYLKSNRLSQSEQLVKELKAMMVERFVELLKVSIK